MPSTQATIDQLREKIYQLRTLPSEHRELAICHLERLARQCETLSPAQASNISNADSQSAVGIRNLDAFDQVLARYDELEKSGKAMVSPMESMIHDLIEASFTEGSPWDIAHINQAEAGPVGDELTPTLTADPVFQCTTTHGRRKRSKSAPCLLEPTLSSSAFPSSTDSPWSAEWYTAARRMAEPYVTIDDDVLWSELEGVNAKVADLELYWPEHGVRMDVVRRKVMKEIYEEGLVSAREM